MGNRRVIKCPTLGRLLWIRATSHLHQVESITSLRPSKQPQSATVTSSINLNHSIKVSNRAFKLKIAHQTAALCLITSTLYAASKLAGTRIRKKVKQRFKKKYPSSKPMWTSRKHRKSLRHHLFLMGHPKSNRKSTKRHRSIHLHKSLTSKTLNKGRNPLKPIWAQSMTKCLAVVHLISKTTKKYNRWTIN